MISIVKIEETDILDADYVPCPCCTSRLCDKGKGTKVNILQFSEARKPFDILLLKCHKCGNRYMVTPEME